MENNEVYCSALNNANTLDFVFGEAHFTITP